MDRFCDKCGFVNGWNGCRCIEGELIIADQSDEDGTCRWFIRLLGHDFVIACLDPDLPDNCWVAGKAAAERLGIGLVVRNAVKVCEGEG